MFLSEAWRGFISLTTNLPRTKRFKELIMNITSSISYCWLSGGVFREHLKIVYVDGTVFRCSSQIR